MKYFISIVVVFFMLVTVSAYAAPEKRTPAPLKKMPPAMKSSNESSGLSGKVVETMNAGGYSYVCIQKNGKKTWIAIPETKVAVGQELTFMPGQEMNGFTSRTLNRTFESIIFSGGLMSPSGQAGNQAKPAEHAGSKAAVSKTEKISVEKAAGPDAYTVADVFAQKSKLHKKTAVVKAKVVKVSPEIMGKNWVHLQDGTGDAAKGTHNLVVTSQDLPKVGDVVTMKGTIYKDKDFGAGYNYNVIMEEASIQKK
jgi:hypothetical protein